MKGLRNRLKQFLWLFLAFQPIAHAEIESGHEILEEGQWLEVRGEYLQDGGFLAARVDLVNADRYEVLIGNARMLDDTGFFTLLGQNVEIHEKTDFNKLTPGQIDGSRVKVEGYYRSEEKFSARSISPRGAGRERIAGRVDRLRTRRNGTEVEIMNYRVVIPPGMKIRHDGPVSSFEKSEPDAQLIVDLNRDEEDLFGKGIWITDHLMLAGQAQARGIREEEFNLNQRNRENRDDLEATVRARFVYQPSASFFALTEINHRQLWRNDEDDGRLSDDNTKLGETYLYWIDPFRLGLDLQAGRVDFDDHREWLYDQNLDAVRAIWHRGNIRAELSYSETLSDGNSFDEATGNSMLYLSNNDDARHLAAYLIHRDTDLGTGTRRTHYGFRAIGEWLPDNESWMELSLMNGQTGMVSNRAWALDLGSTWQPHDHLAFTAGFALGQGDDRNSPTDHTYRQSGLQDNNGKFAGVTSFRYYGELVDPELANLEIATLGIAWLPANGISLDLVWHSYRQHELSTRLVDTDLDRRPSGRDRDIGSELDLVFGWRTQYDLDVEIVAAWFRPGGAFSNTDDAFLGKLQLRYRF